MESPGPRQRRVPQPGPARAKPGNDAFDAPAHFDGRASRKRQQQNAARIDAAGDQASHAMRERVRLAGAGTGNDEEWATRSAVEAVSGCGSLLGVEPQQQRVNASGWWCDDRVKSGFQGRIDEPVNVYSIASLWRRSTNPV